MNAVAILRWNAYSRFRLFFDNGTSVTSGGTGWHLPPVDAVYERGRVCVRLEADGIGLRALAPSNDAEPAGVHW